MLWYAWQKCGEIVTGGERMFPPSVLNKNHLKIYPSSVYCDAPVLFSILPTNTNQFDFRVSSCYTSKGKHFRRCLNETNFTAPKERVQFISFDWWSHSRWNHVNLKEKSRKSSSIELFFGNFIHSMMIKICNIEYWIKVYWFHIHWNFTT